MDAARNSYLVGFNLVRTWAAQRNRPRRSVQRFLERHQNVGLDICSAFRCRFASTKSSERRPSASAAEERFKEIAEAGAAEFKLHAAVTVSAPLMKSAARLSAAPVRRRLKSGGLVRVGGEL